MPSYEVNVDVKKQIDQTACWASLVSAMLPALGTTGPDQDGLRTLFSGRTASDISAGQVDPAEALFQYGFTCDKTSYKTRLDPYAPAQAKRRREDEVVQIIETALRGKVPVICGLTRHNDLPIPKKGGGGGVPWRHAVLVYKIDTDGRKPEISFKDPAKENNDNITTVTSVRFVQSFEYGSADMFGPKTKAALEVPAFLYARVFKLIVPTQKDERIGLFSLGPDFDA